jgi:hypothetical protein
LLQRASRPGGAPLRGAFFAETALAVVCSPERNALA